MSRPDGAPDCIVPLSDAEAAGLERVGPKASTLARLSRAGLPVPDGFCLTADSYRMQLEAAGAAPAAARIASVAGPDARRLALTVRLGLLRVPLDPSLDATVTTAWRGLVAATSSLVAVRSSALCEDTADASFAGQFDTFLGITSREDLVTAIRASWASLWSSRALRYMRAQEVDPAGTAMAVVIQRLVEAQAAGGALSQTPEGELLITGTWGLGAAIAQGEVVPDRFVLRRDGAFERVEPGRKDRRLAASPSGTSIHAVPPALAEAPCLTTSEAVALGRMVLRAEAVLDSPVEVEWAKDREGFYLLQGRPLRVEQRHPDSELWRGHPGLRGHPAGVGWGSGPARIVIHEHDLEHVSFGDVLVTRVAGPALTAVLPCVAGVVAELGGSTSHLAALARERGIPAVLGALEATRRIPEGATVAVDGVAGVVRWLR